MTLYDIFLCEKHVEHQIFSSKINFLIYCLDAELFRLPGCWKNTDYILRLHACAVGLLLCSVSESDNHRIVCLKGSFKGRLAHGPCSEQGHLQLDQVAQSLSLDVSRDGASTTSLEKLSQYFTTLTEKISSLCVV